MNGLLNASKTSFDLNGLSILVDMDGVLCDWDQRFRAGTAHIAHLLPADYYTRPSFDLFADLSDEVAAEVLAAMNEPGFYAELQPIDGAVEALHTMIDLGIHVAIVTSPWLTNPTCAQDKVEWLNREAGAGWGERIVITKDKTLVRGSILIDDKPSVKGQLAPDWEHVFYTQRYNSHLPGRRLDLWAGWQGTILSASVAA